jgi:hypothetical protein
MATSDDEVLPDTTADLYIDPVAERKLVLKLDLCLSPVMTKIFLAAYLDRSNIGNAASAGMTTDLHLKEINWEVSFPHHKQAILVLVLLLIHALFRCGNALLRALCSI